MRKLNLVGKRFGKRVVLALAQRTNKNSKWLCRCDCGKESIITAGDLKRTLSCRDCSSKKQREDAENAPTSGEPSIVSDYWCHIKHGALVRNITFTISKEYALSLFHNQNGKCALSGRKIILADSRKNYNKYRQSGSIDRIDSKLGYVEGNVQWIHKIFQPMKSDKTQELFISLCKEVANNKS